MNSPRLIWALLLAATPLAQAQAAPAYDSAFAGYRTYREPQPASWKDTNEQLLKRPGHMGHGMGAPKPADAPKTDDPHAGHDMSGTKKSAEPAKADPHHGHHGHHGKE